MSRYCDSDDYDYEPWMEGQAAGAMRSAIRGRRGQRLLRDLIAGMDALPTPELAAGSLEDPETGCVCALGAVRLQRGADAVPLRFDPTDPDIDWRDLAEPFDISETLSHAVVSQNEYEDKRNDEQSRRRRWRSVRDWAVRNLIQPPQGGEVQPAATPDTRNPECVTAWPDCYDGGFDPHCCRFPKSCSCGGEVQ